jgi:tetratricopeptide (TPR) repeat protein
MLDLLAQCDSQENAATHGEILFMLGGNLGTLRGDYRVAREFLVLALRNAHVRQDDYLKARCLRKYGDFLRYRGHLRSAHAALTSALALSESGRGTRQRVYALGCLGDLERQRQNYAAAGELFDEAIRLARELYIPGWLGNLHLGLAEIAMARKDFDEAQGLLSQAEAHYRSTGPKHWWGEVQIGLSRSRLMRDTGDNGWSTCVREVQNDAITAGYQRDASFAARLLEGGDRMDNVLMFL